MCTTFESESGKPASVENRTRLQKINSVASVRRSTRRFRVLHSGSHPLAGTFSGNRRRQFCHYNLLTLAISDLSLTCVSHVRWNLCQRYWSARGIWRSELLICRFVRWFLMFFLLIYIIYCAYIIHSNLKYTWYALVSRYLQRMMRNAIHYAFH